MLYLYLRLAWGDLPRVLPTITVMLIRLYQIWHNILTFDPQNLHSKKKLKILFFFFFFFLIKKWLIYLWCMVEHICKVLCTVERLSVQVHVHVLCVTGWGHVVAPAHRSGGHNPVLEHDFFRVLGQVA